MAASRVRLGVPNLCFTRSAAEIRNAAETFVLSYEAKLDALVAETSPALAKEPKGALFDATFGRLANIDGHAALASAELTLPALVCGDVQARTASSEAKKSLQQMWSRAYARADVYERLLAAKDAAETAEQERLVKLVLGRFQHAGAALGDIAAREEQGRLDARAASLAFEIEQNINEDCTAVVLTETELVGCDAAFVKSLPVADDKERDGQVRRACSLKAPVLTPILKRAGCGETRRKLLEASQRKCMERNGPLLDALLQARHAAATNLGFPSHADRMLAPKMAGSAQDATDFCVDMLARLSPLRDAELDKLRARKAAEGSKRRKREEDRPADGAQQGDDENSQVDLKRWDVAFYDDILMREELSLDDEKLKEFFPLEGTIDRMLDIYSELLGLVFKRSSALPTWHAEVVAFEVCEGHEVVGHLYLDQFPRDGKFAHQMIVPLAPSFTDDAAGERCVPACANISNLPRPVDGQPALLRFEEMRTLFHELGHAMHCLCTRTRYSELSWAWPMVPWPGGVEQDFLEVPSMALEKFATEGPVLARIARHFSGAPEAPELGAATIQSLEARDKWMVGTQQSRYFAMALADLLLHARGPPYAFEGQEGLSAQELFARVVATHTRLEALPATHPCASWYHLVIGYDAGYYGYGWSDVVAADIFDAMRQEPKGLLSEEVGRKLKEELLGPCATIAGKDISRKFLGREPTSDAWCRRQGIPARASL